MLGEKIVEKERDVITYDYKTVRVKREMEAMTTDAYENLGWEFLGSSLAGGTIFHVNLSFKRDRKVANKQNLLKLQEKVDAALQNVDALQNKKRSAGTVPALAVGIPGALVFGTGLSMVLVLGAGSVGAAIGGIILGILGAGIAFLAYPLFKMIRKIQIKKIEPLLENEYNKLADICEEV